MVVMHPVLQSHVPIDDGFCTGMSPVCACTVLRAMYTHSGTCRHQTEESTQKGFMSGSVCHHTGLVLCSEDMKIIHMN